MQCEPSRFFKSVTLLCFLFIAAHLPYAFAQTAPSAKDVSSYSGLHLAAHEGDIETTRELIKHGAELEARDGAGRTPLLVAVFASHESIVMLLAEAGADMNAKEDSAYDIVTIAAVADDLEMLNVALARGASARNVTSPFDGTALIAAAHLGHHEVVDSLIKANAPLDHVNNLQWTAVIEAIVLGDGGDDHTKTLSLLLQAGADRDIADGQGVTPLEHAQSRGYEAMITLLSDGT